MYKKAFDAIDNSLPEMSQSQIEIVILAAAMEVCSRRAESHGQRWSGIYTHIRSEIGALLRNVDSQVCAADSSRGIIEML